MVEFINEAILAQNMEMFLTINLIDITAIILFFLPVSPVKIALLKSNLRIYTFAHFKCTASSILAYLESWTIILI